MKQLRKRSLTYYKNLSRKMGTATSTHKLWKSITGMRDDAFGIIKQRSNSGWMITTVKNCQTSDHPKRCK